MKIRVDVMLKQGVLDPQGKAIAHALQAMGFDGVTDARAGKVIELDVEDADPASAVVKAEAMAQKLLANLVIEDYRISVA
ncbi:MAG: phosphoribosylformylglycinamidine synthase subunit PurS [Alphaproteobacteria bacterium]